MDKLEPEYKEVFAWEIMQAYHKKCRLYLIGKDIAGIVIFYFIIILQEILGLSP